MAARAIDNALRAVEIFLEGAAEQLYVLVALLVALLAAAIRVLVQLLDSSLVLVGASLVPGLNLSHARRVTEII